VSPRQRRLVVLLSLGGFFEFYDLLFSAYFAPGLVRDGILTTTGIAGFVSPLFAGRGHGKAEGARGQW
jgi:putative MFS transporter